MNKDSIRERAATIRLVVFDVDGVLTDGRLYLGDGGQEFKVFHSRDGQGLVMLRDSGVNIAIISGRSSPVVAERMAALDIQYVYQGNDDKLPVFRKLLKQLELEPENAAYVGDDLPDVPVMMEAGLALTVADAPEVIVRYADWISKLGGGLGAAREICELIMEAQGTLETQYQKYIERYAK